MQKSLLLFLSGNLNLQGNIFARGVENIFSLQLRRAMESGQFKRAGGGQGASVKLVLSDGSEYAQFASCCSQICRWTPPPARSPRAPKCPTPRANCCPACTCACGLNRHRPATPSPLFQQAVTRTQQGDTVSVAGEDGKVSQRTVKISAAQNNPGWYWTA